MKKKYLLIVLLIFAIIVTGPTYAFWSNNTNEKRNIVIKEGNDEKTKIETSLSLTDAKLVPYIHAKDDNKYQVKMEFNVIWKKTNIIKNKGTLIATVSNIKIDKEDINHLGKDNKDMFFVEVDNEEMLVAGQSKVVIVTVSFINEPMNQAIYEKISGKILTFDITFNVVAN